MLWANLSSAWRRPVVSNAGRVSQPDKPLRQYPAAARDSIITNAVIALKQHHIDPAIARKTAYALLAHERNDLRGEARNVCVARSVPYPVRGAAGLSSWCSLWHQSTVTQPLPFRGTRTMTPSQVGLVPIRHRISKRSRPVHARPSPDFCRLRRDRNLWTATRKLSFGMVPYCRPFTNWAGDFSLARLIKRGPQRRRKPCIGRPRTVPPIISDRDPGSPIRHYNVCYEFWRPSPSLARRSPPQPTRPGTRCRDLNASSQLRRDGTRTTEPRDGPASG